MIILNPGHGGYQQNNGNFDPGTVLSVKNKEGKEMPIEEWRVAQSYTEKLADHLLYITIAGLGEESKTLGDTAKYTVKNVQLRAANVPAFEAPLASWLVPVWIFEMEHEVTFSTSSVIKMPDMIVVLNAIDGGYVKPRIDSRIPGQ